MSRALDPIDSMLLDAAQRTAARFAYFPPEVCPDGDFGPALRDAFDRWVALHGEPVPLLLHHLTGPYGRADL
jgi:hypothetical protein